MMPWPHRKPVKVRIAGVEIKGRVELAQDFSSGQFEGYLTEGTDPEFLTKLADGPVVVAVEAEAYADVTLVGLAVGEPTLNVRLRWRRP